MEPTHTLVFSHPRVDYALRMGGPVYRGRDRLLISERGRLVVPTGANQITWSYGLNTVSYPTYGGEVVQILSTYIDDLQIGGDLNNYHMMEDIYLWFSTYMAVATQGANGEATTGVSKYNEQPVTMWYPYRKWQFKIKPIATPGFKIGRDVVAPTWQWQAAVVEADPEAEGWTLVGATQGLERIDAGIGYRQRNPFSAPNRRGFSFGSVAGELDEIVENYGEIQEAWSDQNMSYFQPHFSGPAKKAKKNEQDK